ncbi:protein FAM189B-like isoform X2 [Micropterus dolomieu]|uniref:protein FAM189B-like isoform X2 n=1 Tax=Micropterus dolomieu TaxID=147949 RepID=UPI001E8CAF74|nr:protein FAM189B-like isoform X2 [Micropterus dolomieu]
MSLPVVLPGSCCPVTGAAQLAEPCHRNRVRGLSASSRIAGGGSRLLLPGRPLLSLGLLQLLLGGSMVALSFGALSLSNSPPIRNSCPFWAGSSLKQLTHRQMRMRANLFGQENEDKRSIHP